MYWSPDVSLVAEISVDENGMGGGMDDEEETADSMVVA